MYILIKWFNQKWINKVFDQGFLYLNVKNKSIHINFTTFYTIIIISKFIKTFI
jgi:hypothetical protein